MNYDTKLFEVMFFTFVVEIGNKVLNSIFSYNLRLCPNWEIMLFPSRWLFSVNTFAKTNIIALSFFDP